MRGKQLSLVLLRGADDSNTTQAEMGDVWHMALCLLALQPWHGEVGEYD